MLSMYNKRIQIWIGYQYFVDKAIRKKILLRCLLCYNVLPSAFAFDYFFIERIVISQLHQIPANFPQFLGCFRVGGFGPRRRDSAIAVIQSCLLASFFIKCTINLSPASIFYGFHKIPHYCSVKFLKSGKHYAVHMTSQFRSYHSRVYGVYFNLFFSQSFSQFFCE